MCGFVVSIQPVGHPVDFGGVGIDTLARGPDHLSVTSIQIEKLQFHIEFAHLFITSPEKIQPLQAEKWMMVINGEIYNYRELAQNTDSNPELLNDAEAFFKHIEYFGLHETIKCTNGMYAGLLIHKENGCCIAFTDHAGKKPLIIWNSKAGRHIGTGVDSAYIDDNSTQIEVLPPGIHDVNIESGVTALDSKSPKVQPVRLPLPELLKMAVADRIPENIPFAVALSGGLDSSILAYIIEKQLCLRPEYYVIGDQLPDSVSSLMESLGIGQNRVKLIRPETDSNLRTLLIDTCRVIKSFNPSIISNGMATMMLAKAVHEDGYRVLLGGEGADEFFCGYQAMYNGKHCPEDMRTALISSLHVTELRRVDLACSYHSVEARCPFLDQRVTSYALGVSAEMHCSKVQKAGKLPLREAYKGLLPDVIINATKEPFDITSGLQLQVIKLLKAIDASERKALEIIFKGIMGSANIFEDDYFSKYPAFDDMIDRRDRKYQANII